MAWKPSSNSPLGLPAVQTTAALADTTAQVPVGTVADFIEDTQGPGRLIYLPGVAALAAGDLVDYVLTPGATATVRHTNATASNSGKPCAVALGAITAGLFGWFQITGAAIVNAVAGTVAGAVMGNATAGSIANTADAGDQILNAQVLTAVGTPSAGKAYAHINHPFTQGQIT